MKVEVTAAIAAAVLFIFGSAGPQDAQGVGHSFQGQGRGGPLHGPHPGPAHQGGPPQPLPPQPATTHVEPLTVTVVTAAPSVVVGAEVMGPVVDLHGLDRVLRTVINLVTL